MNEVSAKILEWHKDIDRDLPWKQWNDPYFIWLSEVILQQTRVQQGIPYFLRFKEKFPTVHHLAKATEEEVMKTWEGLGYYSRARNLHATAKFISQERAGEFPKNYEGLLALKGVGPYTAAAIASFAYGENKAVLDGNVYRVLSRIFDISDSIRGASAQKEFQALADELLVQGKAGEWNQAIMDFGARQCTPKKPNCMYCPVLLHCQAYQKGTVMQRPVKPKAKQRKKRYFHYFLVPHPKAKHSGFYLQQRSEKDIWQGLFQFPMIESSSKKLDWKAFPQLQYLRDKRKLKPLHTDMQILSHQEIYASFYEIHNALASSDKMALKLNADFPWDESLLIFVEQTQLTEYAFPKIIKEFLQQYL